MQAVPAIATLVVIPLRRQPRVALPILLPTFRQLPTGEF
jgi:hypothetical protein